MNEACLCDTPSCSTPRDPLTVDSIEDVKPVVACRACLVTEQPLRPLDHRLADAYGLLISSIPECDSYPWFLCTPCRALLLKFKSFRETCVSAQRVISNAQSSGFTITLDVIKHIAKDISQPLQKVNLRPLSLLPNCQQNNVNKFIENNTLQIAKIKSISIEPSNENEVKAQQSVKCTKPKKHTIYLPESNETVKEDVKKELTSDLEDFTHEDDFTPLSDDKFLFEFANNKSKSEDKEHSSSDARINDEKTGTNDEKSATNDVKEFSDEKSIKIEIDSSLKVKDSEVYKSSKSEEVSKKDKKRRKKLKKLKSSKSEENSKKDKKKIRNPKPEKDNSLFGNLVFKNRKKRQQIKQDEQLYQVLNIRKVKITKEEQKQEILKRRDSRNYLKSQYKCDLCYHGFQIKLTYDNHMEKHKLKKDHVLCDICYISVRKNRLISHCTKYHTFNYLCGQCDHVDKALSLAKTHYLWHKGVIYKCKICGESYDKNSTLQSHMHLLHGNTMIKCSICNKLCNGDHGLRCHMNLSHKEAIGAKCESCNVQFHSLDAMRRHRPNAAVCDRNQRWCAACGEGFRSKALIKEHQTQCQTLLNPGIYRCEKCGKVFDCKYQHDNHRRGSHKTYTGARRKMDRDQNPTDYMCEICGAILSTKGALETHVRTHTGEKPFECDYCQHRFTMKQSLIKHIEVHMSKMSRKPMCPCEYCGKLFTCYAYKRRHEMASHEEFQSFTCEICNKKYGSKESMLAHVRHVHEGVPWPKRQRKR